MRRATTPTHTFTFPDDLSVSEVTEVQLTYSQAGNKILEKSLKDLSIDADKNYFAITLTEAETNLFAPGKALIQLKAKINGTVMASQMIWLSIKPVLDSGDF